MRALVLASAALLALSACDSKPKAPELANDTSALANIEVVTSPGGVTAWLVSEGFVPIVSVQMAWKAGATAQPAEKMGLGWVVAYMMNEGAGDLDTTAYGARMEDLNMEFGCGVDMDWTSCSMTTLKATANESFEMLRLGLVEPRMDQAPIDRAKSELSVGLLQSETNPKTIASRALNNAIMPGHPYSRYPTPETVAKISRDDVIALKNSLMTKDRLLVVVVGDITAEELKPKLDEVFGGLPATSTVPDVSDVAPAPAPLDPVVKTLPIPQTLAMFSGPGIKRNDPDFYAAYVLNYILGGGGFSSRLTDDIREDKGLTYGIGTNLDVSSHLWRWAGSSSTMNDKASEVVRLIKEHIGKLGAEGPTQKELDDAKAYLTGAFPLSFDSNMKIASNLMAFRRDDLGVDYVGQRNDLINAVTLEDVKRVAAAYMKPEAFTFVLVGQPK
ncbi:MAG: pitrilysin family protein [Hyphomonadaceae bacterium]|nr:pitrilysin family protein [Hyphomonadaceae bacterium]